MLIAHYNQCFIHALNKFLCILCHILLNILVSLAKKPNCSWPVVKSIDATILDWPLWRPFQLPFSISLHGFPAMPFHHLQWTIVIQWLQRRENKIQLFHENVICWMKNGGAKEYTHFLPADLIWYFLSVRQLVNLDWPGCLQHVPTQSFRYRPTPFSVVRPPLSYDRANQSHWQVIQHLDF